MPIALLTTGVGVNSYTDAGTTSTFTTAFDDYASSCAVWAKTADPSDYPGKRLINQPSLPPCVCPVKP